MSTTLIEALVAQLGANETITGLFPGGISNTTAAPGTVFPQLTLKKTDSSSVGIIGQLAWVEKITVAFQLYDLSGDAAELAADGLITALMSSATVTWATGQELGRWLAPGRAGQLEEGLGPDGEDVWVETLSIGFNVTRFA